MEILNSIGVKPPDFSTHLEGYQSTATTLLIGLVVLHIMLWSYIFKGKEKHQ